MAELKEQYRIFLDEYMRTFNAKASAIKAGYEPKYAKHTGWTILQKPEVKMEMARIREEQRNMMQAEQQQVIELLQRIAFADITDFIKYDNDGVAFLDSDAIDGQILSEIDINTTQTRTPEGEETSKVKRKLKLSDRMKAIELLGKNMAMFSDNVNHSGKVSVTIIDDIGVPPNAETD